MCCASASPTLRQCLWSVVCTSVLCTPVRLPPLTRSLYTMEQHSCRPMAYTPGCPGGVRCAVADLLSITWALDPIFFVQVGILGSVAVGGCNALALTSTPFLQLRHSTCDLCLPSSSPAARGSRPAAP